MIVSVSLFPRPVRGGPPHRAWLCALPQGRPGPEGLHRPRLQDPGLWLLLSPGVDLEGLDRGQGHLPQAAQPVRPVKVSFFACGKLLPKMFNNNTEECCTRALCTENHTLDCGKLRVFGPDFWENPALTFCYLSFVYGIQSSPTAFINKCS